MNIQQYLEGLKEHEERLAVWETVRGYLQREFLPRDERPPRLSITTNAFIDPKVAPLVRPETIEKMVKEIEAGPILQLKVAIEAANNQPIMENRNEPQGAREEAERKPPQEVGEG